MCTHPVMVCERMAVPPVEEHNKEAYQEDDVLG